MIRFVKHKDIDKQWWDATLMQASNKLPYANSWMLDAVSPNWNALIDEDRGMIMPLPWRKKYGIKYVFTPFPLQQLGVFAPNEIDHKLVDEFLEAIPKTYKKVDLQLNWKCRTERSDLFIEEWINMLVDLDGSVEEIKSGFSKNHMRNIKKHNSSGAEIRRLEDPKIVTKAFRKWKLPDLKGQKIEMENVERLIDACEQNRAGIAYASYLNDELVCAAYFILNMGRIIYLKGASSTEGKKTGAMHAIIDHVVGQHAKDNKVLDLGGSNNPALARFYKGFGAEVSIYLHVIKEAFPGLKKRFKFR